MPEAFPLRNFPELRKGGPLGRHIIRNRSNQHFPRALICDPAFGGEAHSVCTVGMSDANSVWPRATMQPVSVIGRLATRKAWMD